jgi:superfamily II DNA or RNA helicase
MKLRPYQETAADFLYEHDRAMILAPVGAGKTAITLTAMDAMIKDGHVKRWLVIAPKRVCTDVWPVEMPKWSKNLKIAVAIGTPKQRNAVFSSDANVIVINYDNLQWLAGICNVMGKGLPVDGLVFDELTKLKNPSGARFKAFEKIIKAVPVRWGLTGSFTSNGLEDVFGQCKIVDESLLGRSKGAFMQQYFVLVNKDFGEWAPRGCL